MMNLAITFMSGGLTFVTGRAIQLERMPVVRIAYLHRQVSRQQAQGQQGSETNQP